MFPAPLGGWVSNRSLAAPNAQGSPPGASLLENWFPTATGVTMRRGSELYATLGDGSKDVTALFSYVNGALEQLFGATENAIYDLTTISTAFNWMLWTGTDVIVTDTGNTFGENSTIGKEVVTGLTGGDWVTALSTNSNGDVFLVAVNGEDQQLVYDGTTWYPIDGTDVFTLNYDGGTAAFHVGQIVTGGTSAATARIVNIKGTVASGTLIVDIKTGTFQDNEALTDPLGGAAVVNGVATIAFPAITGISPRELKYVWNYNNRLYYIEKDSLNAWYNGANDAVSGTLKKLPLGGIFLRGGSLLFGATWSIDSGSGGSGLSQSCVFMTTEGEVAVYQGLSPDDTNNWRLVGVYRIGNPLGKQAHFRAGGDLVIATDIGLLPLSQAIQRDYAALSPSAVSYSIEDEWNDAVAARFGTEWHCEVWPSAQMVVVVLPTVNEQRAEWFVANTRTGAWAPFTGWDATCLEVFKNRCFYGSKDGKVIEANVTGSDQGLPYTASYAPLFEDLGNPSGLKMTTTARAVLRGQTAPKDKLSIQTEYEIKLPSAPDSTPVPAGSIWGQGIWGESIWGQRGSLQTYQNWHVVPGCGYAIAPALQVTSGSVAPLDIELVRLDVAWESADAIT